MLIYEPNDDYDHIVLFGTCGWKSWFLASFEELNQKIEKGLWDRANKLLPKDVKTTHPDNEVVSWMRVYKFTKGLKRDDI